MITIISNIAGAVIVGSAILFFPVMSFIGSDKDAIEYTHPDQVGAITPF